jgi:hypothetical protein
MGDVAPTDGETFRITDSPWFWGLVFAAMSLVGMALIGPKFERRQGQIEGRFAGREQAHLERQRRAAGLPPIDLSAETKDADTTRPTRIVPLWTLVTLATVAAACSAAMLAREIRGRRGG